MRARREAPEWKQWNSTWANDFANTVGFFDPNIAIAFPGSTPVHSGPYSLSYPAEVGQLNIAGAAPLPIQLANLMQGNTITMRKIMFLFSFKLIPVEFNGAVPPYVPSNNPRNMELAQSMGIRMVFCRFKASTQVSVQTMDPIATLFDSYSTVVPNPAIFDQGTAMIGSFIEGLRNICTVWREKRFCLSLSKPYKEFKVSFKFPRGLQLTKKFDTTAGVYFNDSPISYFLILTTGQNVPFDVLAGNLLDPMNQDDVIDLRCLYGLQLYQLYKYWYTDS
jgi:hypothetical protein